MLSALDDSVSEASRIARGLEGHVVVGCISSVAYSILPQAIARFRADYPDVRISLRDGEGPSVIDALQTQDVEFAVTTYAEQPPDMVGEFLLKDQFVAVCGMEHALVRTDEITWNTLSKQRLVGFRAPSSSRRVLDAALEMRGIELTWFDEVDQLSSLIGFLQSGHFVGVIPELLTPYVPGVKTFRIVGDVVYREIHLLRRKDTPLSASALALWNCVLASAPGEVDAVSLSTPE
ncbi:LysR substrate-binding domain-containing protein [Pseudomonas putida]|uniref:LysR substrate-binding domain-containing protein n=1 Tax=Pseudomonas putida TaxID=303 RepID=UPI00300E96E2